MEKQPVAALVLPSVIPVASRKLAAAEAHLDGLDRAPEVAASCARSAGKGRA